MSAKIPKASGLVLVAAAVLAGWLPGDLVAADLPRVGAEVVLKAPDIPLRFEGADVATGWEYWRYRVRKVEDPWLFVVSEKHAGWIHRDQVVAADQAAAAFTKTLEDDPQATWVYLWRAETRVEKKEYDAALKDLDEAIRRNPRDWAALILRGIVRTEQEQPDKALADLDQAARVNPREPIIYLRRAQAWQVKKQTEKAQADVERALEIDPQNSDGHFLRGSFALFLGDAAKAVACLNEAVRLSPRTAKLYIERGRARQSNGEYDWALADFNEAARLEPSSSLALAGRGDIRFGLGDFAGAASDFAEAHKLDPEQTVILNSHAWFLATCPDVTHRDAARAVQFATKACELSHWKDPQILDTLAAALAEDGRFDEAVRRADEALKLFPADGPDAKECQKRRELYVRKKPFRLDV